jgi:hypothetical protein
MGPVIVLSSDAHVFAPPDRWTTRIDAVFRDCAPHGVHRRGRRDRGRAGTGAVGHRAPVQHRYPLRGAGAISGRARFEDVPQGGSDPDQHPRDMRLGGVADEGLSPSPGLFDCRIAAPALMSAIFRAYDHHFHFCNTTRARIVHGVRLTVRRRATRRHIAVAQRTERFPEPLVLWLVPSVAQHSIVHSVLVRLHTSAAARLAMTPTKTRCKCITAVAHVFKRQGLRRFISQSIHTCDTPSPRHPLRARAGLHGRLGAALGPPALAVAGPDRLLLALRAPYLHPPRRLQSLGSRRQPARRPATRRPRQPCDAPTLHRRRHRRHTHTHHAALRSRRWEQDVAA